MGGEPGGADGQGVRPAGPPHAPSPAGLPPRGTARGGVGLQRRGTPPRSPSTSAACGRRSSPTRPCPATCARSGASATGSSRDPRGLGRPVVPAGGRRSARRGWPPGVVAAARRRAGPRHRAPARRLLGRRSRRRRGGGRPAARPAAAAHRHPGRGGGLGADPGRGHRGQLGELGHVPHGHDLRVLWVVLVRRRARSPMVGRPPRAGGSPTPAGSVGDMARRLGDGRGTGAALARRPSVGSLGLAARLVATSARLADAQSRSGGHGAEPAGPGRLGVARPADAAGGYPGHGGGARGRGGGRRGDDRPVPRHHAPRGRPAGRPGR